VVTKEGYDCKLFTLDGSDHFTVLCDSFISGSAAFAKIKALAAQ